jgi:hypothetical protein
VASEDVWSGVLKLEKLKEVDNVFIGEQKQNLLQSFMAQNLASWAFL